MIRTPFPALTIVAGLSGCVAPPTGAPETAPPIVRALAETDAAPSSEDAADDPAIFVRRDAPERSLVLGTDKQTGLYVYELSGRLVQSLPVGRLNNVDLRHRPDGSALAAASNDERNVVSLFAVAPDGGVALAREFPVGRAEPYGICMGERDGGYVVIVTYKDGLVQGFSLPAAEATDAAAPAPVEAFRAQLASQLEGCVVDDVAGRLFVGEEGAGVWAFALDAMARPPVLVDRVGGPSGLAADVEGLGLWRGVDGAYLVASAQGADRFIVYEAEPPFGVVGAFRVGMLADAVTGTDGLDVTSAALGPAYPRGLLVVQDDVNTAPAANQNFKLVDWRDVEAALGLGATP